MNVSNLCVLLLALVLVNCHMIGGMSRMSVLEKILGKNRELTPPAGKLNLKELMSDNFRNQDELSLSDHLDKESHGDALDRVLHKVMDNMDDKSKEFLEKVGEKMIKEQSKVYLKRQGQKLLDDAAEKIGDKLMDQHDDLSDGHDLNPILELIQSDSREINGKQEYLRKKREVDRLLTQFDSEEDKVINELLQRMANKKTDDQLNHHKTSKHEMKRDTGEESEITMDDLVNVLEKTRNLVPDELAAAAQGALAMGKHLGFRVKAEVQPLASAGYKEVADNYIPQARKAAANLADTSPREAFKILSDMVSQQASRLLKQNK